VLLAIATAGLLALTAWWGFVDHFRDGHPSLLWVTWPLVALGWIDVVRLTIKKGGSDA
jgi:hypothetical protein